MTFQEIKPEGLCKIGPAIEVMAANESLDGHKNAVSVRLDAVRRDKWMFKIEEFGYEANTDGSFATEDYAVKFA